MQNNQNYLQLKSIKNISEFSNTNYTNKLEAKIKHIIEDNKADNNQQIPIADFNYSKETILAALLDQGFTVKLYKFKKFLVCCNPYNKTLRKKFINLETILVLPTQYIHYLSHQYTNDTLGLLHLILFFVDAHTSTDIHLCNDNQIIIKKIKKPNYHLVQKRKISKVNLLFKIKRENGPKHLI